MALWGNNDNKGSLGTVSLNYGNKTVTGTGTTFGQTGAAQVGDIIRFGAAFGGTTGYAGDAVITSIASTISLRIDSTAGLSGGEITDFNYQISECPKSSIKDAAHNQNSGSVLQRDSKLVTTSASRSGIGATIITVVGNASGNNVTAGDSVVYGVPHRLQVSTVNSLIGLSTVVLNNAIPTTTLRYHVPNNAATAGIGTTLLKITERAYGDDPDIDSVTLVAIGDSVGVGTYTGTVSAITKNFPGQRQLTLNTGLTTAVPAGAVIDVTRAVAPSEQVIFVGTETLSGKESQVVGLSAADLAAASGSTAKSQYKATSVGWVGVTTYTDADGNARVKSEVLVAMSGITTGNTAYPPV
jgi:hypothetical protein